MKKEKQRKNEQHGKKLEKKTKMKNKMKKIDKRKKRPNVVPPEMAPPKKKYIRALIGNREAIKAKKRGF